MHPEMYPLNTILSIVSVCTLMHIPCSIAEVYTAGVFTADSINEHLSSQTAFPQGTFHNSAYML